MKHVCVWLLCLAVLVTTFSADALAIERADHVSKKTAHLRKILEPLGSGEDTVVAARLRDKSVVSGFLAGLGPESFVVVEPESKVEHTIAYTQVARFQGYNVKTGVEVHQGTGIRSKLASAMKYVLPTPQVQRNNLTRHQKTLLIGVAIGVVLTIILVKVL